jgi:hypothetical protein
MAITLADMQALYEKCVVHGTAFGKVQWREVSARRARKLRKSGVLCIYSRRTENGKSRYVWRGFRFCAQ